MTFPVSAHNVFAVHSTDTGPYSVGPYPSSEPSDVPLIDPSNNDLTPYSNDTLMTKTFSDKVLKCAEPFRKSFKNLKFRKRLERIDNV